MSSPRSNPIHFPEFAKHVVPGILTGGISEKVQANFDCTTYPQLVEQVWSASDTVTFQLHDVSAAGYRININGDTFTSTAAASPATATTRNWSIALTAYAGQTIRMILEIDTGVSWATIATSPYMKVYRSGDTALNCTRLIKYWGEGFEMGVYYGDDASSPTFEHTLRLPCSNRFSDIDVPTSIVQKDRDGAFNVCYMELDEIVQISTDFIPLWMHRLVNYVMGHRKVTVDGVRYVRNSPFRRNRQIKGTNLFTGDMTLKDAEHLYTTTRAN